MHDLHKANGTGDHFFYLVTKPNRAKANSAIGMQQDVACTGRDWPNVLTTLNELKLCKFMSLSTSVPRIGGNFGI